MFGSANSNNTLVNLNPNPPPPSPSTLPFPQFNYTHQLDPPFSQFPLSNHETLVENTHMGFQETGRNFAVFSASSSSPLLPMPSKAAAAAAGKKDRHSKICTAQGVRDRRVRLSIGIAREFFDLQDMLGYDKASKTLEWLLTKSKKAIREISRANKKQQFAREAYPVGCDVAAPEAADDSKGSSSSSDLTNFQKNMMEMPQEVRARAKKRAASPSGVHHHQSVHSCSSSRRLVKPSQHQYPAVSAPPVIDLARLNTEDKSIDFPLWPQNWDIGYNSTILQPSSFTLQDSEPYI